MVSGHLQVKKGYYYAVLSFYDSKNKRHVKYISTGLPEKGNKRKAEAELVKIRNAFEPPAEIGELCSNSRKTEHRIDKQRHDHSIQLGGIRHGFLQRIA